MIAAQYGSVSDIEIIWVLIALCGVAVSSWNYWQAREDEKALKMLRVPVNGKMRIANTAKTQDAIRITIHGIFALIGFAAMTTVDTPNQSDLPWNIILIQFTITYGLIFGSALLVLGSLLAANLRRDLLFQERQRRGLIETMGDKTEKVMTEITDSENRLTSHIQRGQDESKERDEKAR